MPYKRKSRKYICEARHIKRVAVANTKEISADERENSEHSKDFLEYNSEIAYEHSEQQFSDSFNVRLAQWFSVNNTSRLAANNLLVLLSEKIPELPRDARSLKCTPRSIVKRFVEPGEYVHYGVKNALINFLSNFNYARSVVSLNVNVDGLPLFKSSLKQTWPILININGTKPVMVAGIYVGNSKPRDPNAYLEEFVRGMYITLGIRTAFKQKFALEDADFDKISQKFFQYTQDRIRKVEIYKSKNKTDCENDTSEIFGA